MDKRIPLLLQRLTGLTPQLAALERAIRQRMQHCGIVDQSIYGDRVVSDHQEFLALIDLVTVRETWLFRDPQAFVSATAFVLQRRAAGPERIRILSIPCASGEEPYSLAMALHDAGLNASHFSIDAVDISQEAIECAQRGIFGHNAFRTADLTFRNRHFDKVDNDYQLHTEMRNLVQFQRGNLLSLERLANALPYDLVFCRNLLIYFDETVQRLAIAALSGLLAEHGMLFVGHTEVPAFCRQGFLPAAGPKVFAVRKKTAADGLDALGAVNRAAGAQVKKSVRVRQPLSRSIQAIQTAPATAAISSRTTKITGVSQPAAIEPASLLERARQLADRGEFPAASRQFLAYLQVVPDSADAYFMLGLISERSDSDKAAAENYLRRSIYLQPDHYEALCHLALLTEQGGNAAAAGKLRERAARVFRRQAEGRNKS